jgi:predicted Zn-dependent peptidase
MPFLLALILLAAPLTDEGRIEVPHETYTLGNGMIVILAPDHSLPRVEVNIWYRVGSKDEPAGRSGFAHLFEHLMFMGTERVPEFDVIMEAGGGANNATTSSDRTNYFDWGPATMLETLLWLESDRLEALPDSMTEDKLVLQREVVRNERRQSGENRPYGNADLMVNELMYPPGHPYQISVIGKHEDLEAATVGDVVDFFHRYYMPNNASLTIVGDFDPEHAKTLVDAYFGDLPPGPEPPAVKVDPVVLDGERRIELEDKQIQFPRLSFIYHSPAFMKPGDAEMDLVAGALSGSKSSRLYKRLVVDDRIALQVSAYQASSLLGSQFVIEVYAVPGARLAMIEAAVDEEIARLIEEGPTADELQRSVAEFETGAVSRLESLHARADSLNRYMFQYGDPDGFERDLDRYRRATPDSVRSWARSVLSPDRRLVMSVLPPGSRPPMTARDSQPIAPAASEFEPAVPAGSMRQSGMEVWHLQRTGLPLVNITLLLPGGQLAETPETAGLASLAASMMDEGAGELDALAFGDALQQLGASVGASAGSRETVVSLRVLKRHLDEALDLYHAALTRPRFDAQDFERVQRLQVEGLRSALQDPNQVARQVAAGLWFGSEHPYGRPGGGTPQSVAALDLAAARAFHASVARPQGALLVIAGDVNAEEAAAIADRIDRGWPTAGAAAAPHVTPVPGLRPMRVVMVDRPGAPQTVLRFMMPGQAGTDPKRLATDVLNTALGGSFTSRLNQNLREDKGYTYGARSGFARFPDQGLFIASSSVRTDVTGASIGEFLMEFARIRAGDVDAAEAASSSSSVRSRLVAGYESLGSTVGTWLAMRDRGSPPQAAAGDLAALGRVTAEELNALANSAIPVEHMLLVMVGDASAVLPQLEGLPLPPVEIVDEHGLPVEEGR